MVSTRHSCANTVDCQEIPSDSCRTDRAPHLAAAAARTCQGKAGCVPDEAGAADLRRRYLALLARSLDDELWQDIWQLFITHDWFQAKLEMCARVALRSSGLTPQWVDDVKQEVIVCLARKLRRMPDMHLDRKRPAHQFGGWLYRILLRDSQQAIRKLRRLHCRSVQLYDNYVVNDCTAGLDARIDFEDALRKLDDPELTVIVLYGQGYAVREIAEALGFSNSKAYRTLNRGMARLERRLGEPIPGRVGYVKRSPR